MRSKAAVASVLSSTRSSGPWPTAAPASLGVGRLPPGRAPAGPASASDQPILSGATGATLAFGLGRVPGTGTGRVLAGHRDTWAAFLQDLRVGDQVVLEAAEGKRVYRVGAVRVVAPDAIEVLSPTAEDRLTLVTCWPFSGWRGHGCACSSPVHREAPEAASTTFSRPSSFFRNMS